MNAIAINYYSPTLFGSLGVTDVALYTGIYGLVKGECVWQSLQIERLNKCSSCRIHHLLCRID